MTSPTTILSSLARNILRVLPYFVVVLALAIFHFRDLSNLLAWGIQASLFALGSMAGLLVFVFQDLFKKMADEVGQNLAENSLVGRDSQAPVANPVPAPTAASPQANVAIPETQSASTQILKKHIILVVLPIAGIFVLSSTGSALGQGFVIGLSLIYLADIIAFLRAQPSDFPVVYFPHGKASHQAVQALMIWFLLFLGLFAVVYLAV